MIYDKTVVLPLNVDQAFELITQPERLRRWQTVAARVDLRVGGEYRWTVTPGHHATGTFTEIEPGKRVVFTWGWEQPGAPADNVSTVAITLEPADGGTSVRLVHEGLPTPEAVAAHAEGWNHYLDRLVAQASVGDAGADEWAAAPAELNELTAADATLVIVQRVLAHITEADRQTQTPCADFNVAQLLDHLAGSVAGIAKALGAEVADDTAKSPEVRIADLAQPTLEAFYRRGLEGTVDMGFAELPATIVASILNLEFLVHAWDFAKALGLELSVADELTDYVEVLAQNTISEPVRAGGSFAPAQEVAETASSLERLVAFTGRAVLS
ncbi:MULTISPECIES: TIGR03086 family metal-binding protein [Arthrobacter]|uniref:TIGR03086 family protein n=1 Tax=Arthrobacter terricola TaxID=2547396 RepID=A0A4R5KQ13_9MICC|nr:MULTISPECIES: TIGR03086 family metal-binding protein [Arthrobacter]MBT8160667.1 TIGR03086 family protein [Arthrobacter sp. GN70]TDF97823.1 TIGR03086 family protein [Arthrobacter terricola]